MLEGLDPEALAPFDLEPELGLGIEEQGICSGAYSRLHKKRETRHRRERDVNAVFLVVICCCYYHGFASCQAGAR